LETTSRVEPKNHKKDAKKKNLLAMDSSNQVERNSDVDENIFYTSVQKEVNLSSLHHQEEKEMTKLFHIKIQVKKTKIDAMFNSGSQANLIAVDLVNKLGLEVHDHPIPYPLGWVNKPLDICGVVFGIPYMYMRDAIFMWRSNQYTD
jgi:hypothetical protein